MILLCSTTGFVIARCVRLSRLLVGFRTHFKSLHFHSFIHSFIIATIQPLPQPHPHCSLHTIFLPRAHCILPTSLSILMQSFLPTPLLIITASFISFCTHLHKSFLPPFCLHLSLSTADSSRYDMVHGRPHFSTSTAVVHDQTRTEHTMPTGKQ